MDLINEENLYLAYRKAKADMFYERSVPSARKFAKYEEDLQDNIVQLKNRLNNPVGVKWYEDRNFIGDVAYIPKKFTPPNGHNSQTFFFSSNAEDNWNQIFRGATKGEDPIVEFRPMADFSVDMHIVNALWINHVGEKLDACLSPSAMGSRLRRISGNKLYHKRVWQSFEPYYRSYKKWRDDGFAAIEKEVSEGRKAIALTMDFRRFYHRVDPFFMLHEEYLKVVRKKIGDGFLAKETDERVLTESLVNAFAFWSKLIPNSHDDLPAGLPVGAAASRVIANALLIEFDQIIKCQIAPLYYARYVDDIFLVLRDNSCFDSPEKVLEWISKRSNGLINFDEFYSQNRLTVSLPYFGKSRIEFQAGKQKIFLIDITDLIEAIRSKVDEVSSEWRLLPDLKQMEVSAAARVLSTSRDGSSDEDSLRKADTLLLKRLGYSILLRNAESLVDALPAREWKKERLKFFEFSLRHIFGPDKFFELSDYIPRLFGIAVSCQDLDWCYRIIETTTNLMERIQKHSKMSLDDTTQDDVSAANIWQGYQLHLRKSLEDAMLKSFPATRNQKVLGRYSRLFATITNIWSEWDDFFNENESVIADKMFCRDLARQPFKSCLLGETRRPMGDFGSLPDSLPSAISNLATEIGTLLKSEYTMPVLFPTRPLSPQDISLIFPNKAADIRFLKRFLNAVRGTHYRTVETSITGAGSRLLTIGLGQTKWPPRIAVTSHLTDITSWCRAAGKKPELTSKRFVRLADLCNSILKTPAESRPHYVLFPELSIPTKWIRMVAETFQRSGISLIAGEEYLHHKIGGMFCVDSPARIFLSDNRLGYRSWCALKQLKGKAAHHERSELREKFGIDLQPSDSSLAKKFIFNHFGFRFGILICSELTDLRHRLSFRGKVDALFVLSWNQDLESFSALVDATALDVHCYVALVNNRMFGDSRVRVPFKESWRRDAVRVKGGLADYFVVAGLDIESLRNFQCHAEPPDGPFKPFPEGFEASRSRSIIPGTKK